MHGRLRFAPLAILAAALLLAPGVGAQVPFTSAQGGYSVSFPAEPRETVETKPEAKISSYIIRKDDTVYGSSHVDYNSDLDIEQDQAGLGGLEGSHGVADIARRGDLVAGMIDNIAA